MVMFFVGFKAPSFLHIFAIRKMKSRTPEPELFNHPSSLGIADFGFDIPWASVLLVLKQGGRCHGY